MQRQSAFYGPKKKKNFTKMWKRDTVYRCASFFPREFELNEYAWLPFSVAVVLFILAVKNRLEMMNTSHSYFEYGTIIMSTGNS